MPISHDQTPFDDLSKDTASTEGASDGPDGAAERAIPPDGPSGRARTRPASNAGPGGPAPSFASILCLMHRTWVVDQTNGDDALPVGWHELLTWVFADLALVVRRGRSFALRRLASEEGGLAVALEPLRRRRGEDDACAKAVDMVLSHAAGASRRTCHRCGAPGLPPRPHRLPVCDAHGASRTGTGDRLDDRTASRRATPRGEPAVAQPRDVERLPLYDLGEVASALGRGDEGEDPNSTFSGDPEPRLGAEVETDQAAYLRCVLRAGEGARWRDLARPDEAQVAGLRELARRAPQMREVVDLASRHLRATIAMGTQTTLPPLLLVGPPGTGKTWFAERLARTLGVPLRRHPMNVATIGDGLTGSHPVWRNARPGLVARTLLAEAVANPVILVDEVDKAVAHNGEDAYRPLYACLEPESSRRFVDEFLGFALDASRVSWLLTANAVEPMPAAIVDRLTIVEVPSLDEAHLRAIAVSVFAEANAERRSFFEPPSDDVVDRFAAASPRRMRRVVVEAMTRAAADGRRALLPDDIVPDPPPSRRRAGFGSWS